MSGASTVELAAPACARNAGRGDHFTSVCLPRVPDLSGTFFSPLVCADAAHLLSDVGTFCMSLLTITIAIKKSSHSHSFGCVLLLFSGFVWSASALVILAPSDAPRSYCTTAAAAIPRAFLVHHVLPRRRINTPLSLRTNSHQELCAVCRVVVPFAPVAFDLLSATTAWRSSARSSPSLRSGS